MVLGGGVAYASDEENVPFGQVLSFESRTHFNPVGSSARAIGMGGAFIGVADDATAASFNPAGLAQLEYPELSVVARQGRVDIDYTGFTSFDHSPPVPLSDSSVGFSQWNLDFFSVTLPFEVAEHNIAVQVGFQDLFDLYSSSSRSFDEMDDDGVPEFHLTEVTRQGGGFHTISASVAAQITDRLSVGWTVSYWLGGWTLDGLYRETGIQDPSEEEFVRFHQKNDFSGWNHNFGVMCRYARIRVGAVLRAPFEAGYDYTILAVASSEESNLPSGTERTKVRWPFSIGTGVSFQPTDRFSFAVDIARTWWSGTTLSNPRDPGLAINFFDLKDPTTIRDTTSIRGGVEYLFAPGSYLVPLRFGVFRDPPPAADTGTGDRPSFRGITAGTGIKRGPIQLDVAAEYRFDTTRLRQFVEPETIAEGVESEGAAGTVAVHDVRFYVSAIYRVPNRTAIKDLFRFLFVGPRQKTEK